MAMSDAVATREQLLRRAAEALGEADWEAAKGLFSRALEQGETPEALEGLATAAFFLDEVELVFDARERAYAGYRGAGRVADAARIAIALAWDYRTVRGKERSATVGWHAPGGCSRGAVQRGNRAGWRCVKRRSGCRVRRGSRASAVRRRRRSAASWATSTWR
jgi:hypothetical protein